MKTCECPGLTPFDSPLVEQIAFTNNGALRMATTRTYDFLNRLTRIETLSPTLSPLSSFSYAYNAASQRSSATNEQGEDWRYSYDILGQVVSGRKYTNNTSVPGCQFDYRFDEMGNRRCTTNEAPFTPAKKGSVPNGA